MYFDFSIKKLMLILVTAGLLALIVAQTFLTKQMLYGTTPFFPSIGLFLEEQYRNVSFALREVTTDGKNAALALMGATPAATPIDHNEAEAIPVLTYHRVVRNSDGSNITEKTFEEQMRALKAAGWQTVRLPDLEAFLNGKKNLPEKSFLITFDDGAKQSFYPVDSIFKELGYSAITYLIVKFTETPGSTYYLSTEEIKRLLATGRWEIGSHSYDGHRPYPVDTSGTLGNFYADKLWRPEDNRNETSSEFATRVYDDMVHSRQALETTYGVTVDTFAFPLNETGAITAGNFNEGVSITDTQASRVYSYGFLQTGGQGYSYNYPQDHSFLMKRIHVDHDWSGAKLLTIIERGLPKDLPFEDDFSKDKGWLASWGSVIRDKNMLALTATTSTTGADSILDGSYLWDEYKLLATVHWYTGYAVVASDVVNNTTYRACVFSPGKVEAQSRTTNNTTVLGRAEDLNILLGETREIGIQSTDNELKCFFDGKEVLSIPNVPNQHGGVEIQTWSPELNTAGLEVSKVKVIPL